MKINRVGTLGMSTVGHANGNCNFKKLNIT